MNHHVPWGLIKNSLLFGMDVSNTMTIHYDDGEFIKELRGSLFKLSDMDEEIIIKNEEDFYILRYNEIRFAAVNVS